MPTVHGLVAAAQRFSSTAGRSTVYGAPGLGGDATASGPAARPPWATLSCVAALPPSIFGYAVSSRVIRTNSASNAI